ncbi:A disintegrin and metalloproteinase with thrombospondin motifs 12 [Araneus ventricosus]|uniref:A disintegrin and metalloproteinase with thrombospondin motifs 12 n=1 Tax=Araneus ventricosus TaxID=182803 RepID=A0A4Y2U2N1_ARAVE|nr:A disintegrin and metalloproteinase with thrombospondin motifs 12 [Araneus ventricosus]
MGRCTEIGERPEAIDGEWGQWEAWSPCSRTCGAGVSLSQRHCDNPMPAGGGRYCIGERKRYKMCNTQPCPENSPSFRAVQCSAYDDVPYKEELHTWLPVATPMTPCQLHCKPDGKFFSVMLSDTVADGTECNPGTRDVCINGKCRVSSLFIKVYYSLLTKCF